MGCIVTGRQNIFGGDSLYEINAVFKLLAGFQAGVHGWDIIHESSNDM